MGAKGFYRSMVIIVSLGILALGAAYVYYLVVAIDEDATTNIILDAISIIVFIILFLMGLIGAIKRRKTLVRQFATMCFLMFVFGVVQIILSIIAYENCNADDSNPFRANCSINKIAYYVPTAFQLLCTFLGCVFGTLYFFALKKDQVGGSDKGNIY